MGSVLRGMTRAVSAMIALLLPAMTVGAQEVPAHTMRSVAAVVGLHGKQRVTLGSAFFVEVPSKVFAGSSFVYLITAHHVLLDSNGRPVTRLWAVIEDSRSGASREESLPDESRWLLDPKHESTDIAALPFNPPDANIAPIPLSSLFAEAVQPRVGLLPESVDVGASCYFLTAAALGENKPRFVPLARFCRVSVAEAAQALVPGAGSQPLYLVDASAPAKFSGAPVFAHAGERLVLFGMMEPEIETGADSPFSDLAGVVPAGYIAETVEAMAAAQERKTKGRR
jgi:hypothetical protein